MTMSRPRTAPRTQRRFSRPRKAVEWFDTIISVTIAASAQAELQLLGGLVVDEFKGARIVRTIVDLFLVATTAGTGTILSTGIAMINRDALSAGAVPEADDTADKGWLWRTNKSVFTSVVNESQQQSHLLYDSRTSRRMRSDDDLMSMVFNTNAGASSINIDGLVRVLVEKS